jgi:transcriptional regulator with XRE-family HTH domain
MLAMRSSKSYGVGFGAFDRLPWIFMGPKSSHPAATFMPNLRTSSTRSEADEAPAEQEIRVGGKLKHARLLKGMTLKQVSEAARCSESLLSKIENGRAYPSLPTLHRIAVSLETNVAALLASGGDAAAVVFHPAERLAAAIDVEGIRLERLFPHQDGNLLESTIHRIAPGASNEGAIVHQGEELGYVLEGEIELIVGGKVYLVPSGASFHFRSEVPHGYRNATDQPAKVLWVSTPPTF